MAATISMMGALPCQQWNCVYHSDPLPSTQTGGSRGSELVHAHERVTPPERGHHGRALTRCASERARVTARASSPASWGRAPRVRDLTIGADAMHSSMSMNRLSALPARWVTLAALAPGGRRPERRARWLRYRASRGTRPPRRSPASRSSEMVLRSARRCRACAALDRGRAPARATRGCWRPRTRVVALPRASARNHRRQYTTRALLAHDAVDHRPPPAVAGVAVIAIAHHIAIAHRIL